MIERKIIALAVMVVVVCGAIIGVQCYQIQSLQKERAALTDVLVVLSFERHILGANRQLSVNTARRIALAGIECARLYDLDRMLLFATMYQESNFNPRAVGPANERGLTQLTRGAASAVGLSWDKAFDIDANTCAGAAYLARHVHERGVERGLLRYNGGGAPGYPALVLARYEQISKSVSTP